MKDLYSIIEDLITYSGHSEICGCTPNTCGGLDHEAEWTIQVPEHVLRLVLSHIDHLHREFMLLQKELLVKRLQYD